MWQDFSIVAVVLAIAAAGAIYFTMSLPEYQNPVQISVENTLVLDFISDYSAAGYELMQDPETGTIFAKNESGGVVSEITSAYLSLQISEVDGIKEYSLIDKATVN
jgi:hypothetical protein